MRFDRNNLKMYRKRSGLTQEQLAEKIGVSRQSVAKWERGDSLPDIENVIALADLYEVTIDSLVRDLTSLDENAKTVGGDGKHMFGAVRVKGGQITLPKRCRKIFGISDGDLLLLLGDEERGLALVKISEILDK